MQKKFLFLVPVLVFVIMMNYSFAQSYIPQDWHLKDYQKDSVYGISLEKAYDLLKGRTAKKVIVAVIDSGADTLSEDLKDVLWINEKEVPGDGIDNDKNGYTDDIYGWNFLGDKNNINNNVNKDSYEAARVYFKYKDQFENNISGKVRRSQRKAYSDWQKAKSLLAQDSKEQKEIDAIEKILKLLPDAEKKLSVLKKNFSKEDLLKFEPQNNKQKAAKLIFINIFTLLPEGVTSQQIPSEAYKIIAAKRSNISLPAIPPPSYRSDIVKDNYENIKDKYYGNYNVAAPDVSHGTHVSGIIAADRKNDKGILGIADNVSLMQIRAVPNGDEHDKDIALAIRYAVDNGAEIINMSFGKQISPELKWVEDALKYAEKKNVLIIHAAGNDARNIDGTPNYPTQFYGRKNQKTFNNIITVGANGARMENFIPYFSNFGKQSVDVFAPGVSVYSTMPGISNYAAMSGTSMASPVVAGIAALLKSYFPQLKATDIKKIIESSVTKIDFPVTNPETKQTTTLSQLSKTGGIVNAYNAVLKALNNTYK